MLVTTVLRSEPTVAQMVSELFAGLAVTNRSLRGTDRRDTDARPGDAQTSRRHATAVGVPSNFDSRPGGAVTARDVHDPDLLGSVTGVTTEGR
jgi:hypothetical protein